MERQKSSGRRENTGRKINYFYYPNNFMISPHIALAIVFDDLIKLLVYKRKNGNTKEADVLELTHEGVERIFNTLLEENHALKLEAVIQRTKAKMLEQELKTIYNELYKRDQKFANEMIVRSYIPTKRQISEEVIIKNPELPSI
jgi:hypothetical protein